MTLKKILTNAIRTVNETCVLGSANRVIDYERTNGWSTAAWRRSYHMSDYIKKIDGFSGNETLVSWRTVSSGHSFSLPVYFPLKDECDPLQQHHSLGWNFALQTLISHAIALKRTRVGNCLDKSYLLAYNLWEKDDPAIRRIEVVVMNETSVSHAFVVINRKAESSLTKPEEWNAMIVDPWVNDGEIFHSRNYNEKMRNTTVFYFKQVLGMLNKGLVVSPQLTLFKGLFKFMVQGLLSHIASYSTLRASPLIRFCIDYGVTAVVDIDMKACPYPFKDQRHVAIDDFYDTTVVENPSDFLYYSQMQKAREIAEKTKNDHRESFEPTLKRIKNMSAIKHKN